MRKNLVASMAAAAAIFSAGAFLPESANAVTFGAGMRPAIDAASPVENVRWYRWHHRRYFRGYAFYPRRHFYYRHYYYRHWW